MQGSIFSGLGRPRSELNRSKPMPLVAKGVGGSSASVAPKSNKPNPNPGKTNIFRR